MRRLLIFAALLGGCGDESGPEVPDDADLVPFQSLDGVFGMSRIASGWGGGQNRLDLRDQAHWAAVYSEVTGETTAPSIDFTDRAVFFATAGDKPSTGHDIIIDEVRKEHAGWIYIMVREVTPGSGCNTQPTPTSPVTAILTINAYSSVVYVEDLETDLCTVSMRAR